MAQKKITGIQIDQSTLTAALAALTPTSVAATGTVTGSNISGSSSGTNTGDQTITLTGDVTGSGTGSFAATLATVNSNVGQFAVSTVNAKGLVTAATTLTGDITSSGAATTLATVNSNVGSFGTASSTGSFTVNAKGLVTAASNTSIQIAETQITDGALLARVNANETITGNWTFNNPVVGADPTVASNFATKQYVDNALLGLTWKTPVVAATTADITLSGAQTIDGVSVVATNRVLVKNQSSTLENGIYVVAAGAWTRSTDFDSVTPIDEINGAAVFVTLGTTQGDTGWTETATVVTVGTDPITFVQFSAAGTYIAGAGLSLSGNTFNVGTASASRIVVNVDDIDLATVTDAGTGTFLKLTRDAYGRVSGTTAVVAGDITALVGPTLPGGSSTELQYNNAGAFGGITNFTYISTTGALAYAPSTFATPGALSIVAPGHNGVGTGANVTIGAGTGGTTSGNGGAVTVQGGAATDGNGGAVSISGRNGVGTNRLGGALTLTGGSSTGTTAGANINITAGTGGATGDGGPMNITAGAGGSTSGNGGSIVIQGGLPVSGTGGAVTVSGRSGAGASGSGGIATITGGAGTGSGVGGNVVATGGSGGTTGSAGIVTITGGAGGSTSGAGGAILIQGGSSTDGNGGAVSLTGTNATGTNRFGGNATLTAGNSTGVADGGVVTITAGTGGTTANGGAMTLTAGAGGATSGTGGAATFQGGLPVNGNGGTVAITGRNGVGTNRNGGNVTITAGNLTGSGTGGAVIFNTLGSTERMRIAAAGNVTIAAPTSGTGVVATAFAGSPAVSVEGAGPTVPLLQVSNTSGAVVSRATMSFTRTGGTAKEWHIGNDTTAQNLNDFEIRDVTRGAIPLTITTTGIVYIGTPAAPCPQVSMFGTGIGFQAFGAAATTQVAFFSNGSTTASSYASLNNTAGSLLVGVASSAGGGMFPGTSAYAAVIGTAASRNLELVAENVVRVVVGKDGNIVINTPDLGVALTVNATSTQCALFTSAAVQENTIDVVSIASQRAGLRLGGNATTLGTASFDFYMSATSEAQLVNRSNTAMRFFTNAVGTALLSATGSFTVIGTAGTIGYGAGSGGTVTQATSKSTGVTLNKGTGQITMNGAALAAATSVSFTFNNSLLVATDCVLVNIQSGGTQGAYFTQVDTVTAGACVITLRNYTAGSLSEALVLNFAVFKGVTA